MSGSAVDAMLYMLDEAFDPPNARPSNQSLLPNLGAVSDEVWCTVPPGGSRSIKEVALHVGSCKYVYDNYAFGDASLTWQSKLVSPWPDSDPHPAEVIDWIRAGHRRFRHHVAELVDSDLDIPRKANWGIEYPTRWLINVIVQHDLYHAGEINHIRSLLTGDDRWAHDRELSLA